MTLCKHWNIPNAAVFCDSLFPSIVLGKVYSHCFTSDATASRIFTTLDCNQWSTGSMNLSYKTISFICLVTKRLACGPSLTTLIALQKLGESVPRESSKYYNYCNVNLYQGMMKFSPSTSWRQIRGLTSELDGSVWLNSLTGHFHPGKEPR
jgi:hypothetical protein